MGYFRDSILGKDALELSLIIRAESTLKKSLSLAKANPRSFIYQKGKPGPPDVNFVNPEVICLRAIKKQQQCLP